MRLVLVHDCTRGGTRHTLVALNENGTDGDTVAVVENHHVDAFRRFMTAGNPDAFFWKDPMDEAFG